MKKDVLATLHHQYIKEILIILHLYISKILSFGEI